MDLRLEKDVLKERLRRKLPVDGAAAEPASEETESERNSQGRETWTWSKCGCDNWMKRQTRRNCSKSTPQKSVGRTLADMIFARAEETPKEDPGMEVTEEDIHIDGMRAERRRTLAKQESTLRTFESLNDGLAKLQKKEAAAVQSEGGDLGGEGEGGSGTREGDLPGTTGDRRRYKNKMSYGRWACCYVAAAAFGGKLGDGAGIVVASTSSTLKPTLDVWLLRQRVRDGSSQDSVRFSLNVQN